MLLRLCSATPLCDSSQHFKSIVSRSWRFAAWFRADTPDTPTYSHQSDVSYFCRCLQFRYGKRRINHLYSRPSGSSWWGLMHKGQEVIVTLRLVKIQNQMSISGQNPAGFIQAPKEAPKTVLDSGRQRLHDHRGACVPSHTSVERHLHACICRDPGNTHAQVRTCDSDLDRSRPRDSERARVYGHPPLSHGLSGL